MSELKCPYCHKYLVRVHKGGQVYCSGCDEPLLKNVSSNVFSARYIKCQNAKCGFDENMNPKHGDKCSRCNYPLL